MPTLAERLLVEDRRDTLIARCVTLVETQVDRQGTVRRIALKAGIAVVNAIRPNALSLVVSDLLHQFTHALEPLYQQFHIASGRDFSQFLQMHPDKAVQALIAVTDARAEQLGNAAVREAYRRLRPGAGREVRAALPGLSQIIAEHLAAATTPQQSEIDAANVPYDDDSAIRDGSWSSEIRCA